MPTFRVLIGAVSFAVLATASVLAVVACGNDLPANRTGIQGVDLVLDAIESDDAEQIEALVSFGQRPCDRPEPGEPSFPSHGGIMCREGEATGKLVDTFWGSSCEGSWWGRIDADGPGHLANTIVGLDLSLYGVYISSVAPSEFWVTSDQMAIFAWNDDGILRGYGLFLREGRIVGTDVDCGLPPADMAELDRLIDPILLID